MIAVTTVLLLLSQRYGQGRPSRQR